MSSQAFDFQTLNPDIVIDALLTYGIRVDSGLTPLNSYENRVYQFYDEQRQRLVVKFYRPQRWSAQQITEEHQFAFTLQQHDIPLAVPLTFSGASVLLYQGFYFAVYASVGGRQYEADNLDQMAQLGGYIARLHQAGQGHLFTARPTMDVEEYVLAPQQCFRDSTLIPPACKTAFLQAGEALARQTLARWPATMTRLRLHGDCHPGNILWRDGPFFVDLDDARNGPAMQDLWMLLHGDAAEQRLQMSLLAEAYDEYCPFNAQQLKLIEPLRAMRLLYYQAWLMRRWNDPAFPRHFPWLAETEYWQRQIGLFNDQCQALDAPALSLAPMY